MYTYIFIYNIYIYIRLSKPLNPGPGRPAEEPPPSDCHSSSTPREIAPHANAPVTSVPPLLPNTKSNHLRSPNLPISDQIYQSQISPDLRIADHINPHDGTKSTNLRSRIHLNRPQRARHVSPPPPPTNPHDNTKSTNLGSQIHFDRPPDGCQGESEIEDWSIWYNSEDQCAVCASGLSGYTASQHYITLQPWSALSDNIRTRSPPCCSVPPP